MFLEFMGIEIEEDFVGISHFFKRKEFECNCGCGQDTVDYELLLVMDMLRHHFDKPVRISSGNRCFNHNRKIGGSQRSQHLRGKAADFTVVGVEPQAVYGYLDSVYPDHYGMGDYVNFTHFDVRANKARW